MNVAVLVEVIRETNRNWRFIFESPLYDRLDFIPGQLVQLVALPFSDEPIVRNYSVSSWPDGTNRFELIITNLQGGKMSDYLFKNARVGDEFQYRGPMGVFTLPQVIDRDIFFVSTGSGISPFRSMVNWMFEKKVKTQQVKLFFGTRTSNEIPYKSEWIKLKWDMPKFDFIPTLSQEDNWMYKSGYVHKHYLELIDSMEHKPLVYFCGWSGMINEGRQHLIERGFEMGKDIRVEIFG